MLRMQGYQLTSKKFLSPDEYSYLGRSMRKLERSNRDRLILQVAIETGARASEVLGLRRADIIPSSKSVLIRGLKGSWDREIPLRPVFFSYLQKQSQQSETELVFNIGYHRFRQIWDWHRPCEKPLHCLRHTFAIRLYQRTKDLRLVQFALGHRSISNTMIYARYHYSQTELRKILHGSAPVSEGDKYGDSWNFE